MITLTHKAAEHIKTIMAQHEGAVAFRLSTKQTGCSGFMYMPEVVSDINPNDIKIETAQGIIVLLDPDAEKLVAGTEVDFVTKDFGMQQLMFNNPNIAGLCGCGESFHMEENNDE